VGCVCDGLVARGAGAIGGAEAGRVGEAGGERGHAAGFGAAELGEDGPDCDVLD